MFSFTKKLALIASLVTLGAGQFVAFGSNSNNQLLDNAGNPTVLADPVAKRQLGDEVTGNPCEKFNDGLPLDVMKLIFTEASKVGSNPRHLRLVCRHWAKSMKYVVPEHGPATKDFQGIPYLNKTKDNFMEDCMRQYMHGVVSRGILYFRRGLVGEETNYRLFNYDTIGFTRSGYTGPHYIFSIFRSVLDHTTFFTGTLVTYFTTYHSVRHVLPADAKGAVSDMVVIWKWRDEQLLNAQGQLQHDFLIIKPAELGLRNMNEHWKNSVRGEVSCHNCGRTPCRCLHDSRDFTCWFMDAESEYEYDQVSSCTIPYCTIQ